MKTHLRGVAGAVVAGSVVASGVMAVPAAADHAGAAVSTGIYRIPYEDGTEVGVTNDHHNHNVAYDMSAGQYTPVVAAASGWIRAIVDHNGEEPNAGDGLDAQDPPQPQDDTLEHACGNNDPTNTVVGSCSDYNNYVWIEHPNGEYTKYSHLGTGTVSANWSEDDWIEAGEVIGLENDIGAASTSGGMPGDRAFHLHWEIAAPNDPDDDLVWSELGGFIQNGSRRVAAICDVPDNRIVAGETYTAEACQHDAPTADAGGPYSVAEGSSVVLDGTASSDPDGNPLTYAWGPDANLDDASLAQPTYTGIDDTVDVLTLAVYDQIEQLDDTDTSSVTVTNVAPTVSAAGDTIDEGGTANVSATFTDPGTLDTHTISIDWGDGGPITLVPTPAQLANGVAHTYGDNGTYGVTVEVTDDDGGVGSDTVDVVVGNLDPGVTLGVSDTVMFPGGDYPVVEAGGELDGTAEGTDAGSDDLTFNWTTGDVTTYFNNGVSPDPFPSPFGTFPFAAGDSVEAGFGEPGVGELSVIVADDDGGSAGASSDVIVTGTATKTRSLGWWMHQFSGLGNAPIDEDLSDAYLDIVNAVSSVFSETQTLGSAGDAHDILSPPWDDPRARAEAQLLLAWLHFASGAVDWDATVKLSGNEEIGFLDLMFGAEQIIVAPLSTNAQLGAVAQDLQKVRHAS